MKRSLTKRALVVAGAGITLVLAGSTAQAGWLFVLAAAVLGLLGVSLLVTHRLTSFEVERVLPAGAAAGSQVTQKTIVRNGGKYPLPLLRMEDHFEAFEPAALLAERLAPGASAGIDMSRTARTRGSFQSGSVVVKSGWPFGLIQTRREIEVDSRMVVYPTWVELGYFPILEPSSSPSEVLHERARTGGGVEFAGVREYRPGDPRRAVHWRSTARHGKLIVREFEEEVATPVAIVLIGADDGAPPDSAFESLVSVAASIALYALVTGHPVELFGTGPRSEMTHLSGGSRTEILDWLARVQPRDASALDPSSAALARLGRKGTVVVCATTRGAAGSSLAETLRTIQTAGSRAVGVVAISSTWSSGSSEVPIEDEEGRLQALSGGRALVRVVRKGEDLLGCLQA